MKKNLLFTLVFGVIAMLLASCSNGESPKFHPNIAAFTSGTISRYAPVSISFNENLPADKQTQEFLSKCIKVSPSVDVKFNVTDNYIVTMQPTKPFDRDTEYKVSLKMDKLIDDVDSDLDYFAFKFKTLPLLCHGDFEALKINSSDENKYDVNFVLVTADNESASDAESLVSFSEGKDIKWSHDANGRVHTATIAGVEPGNASRSIKYNLKNCGDYQSEGSIVIPDKNDFSVYDIAVKEGSERCAYIYFTKNLDMEQDIKGLAYIDGNTNERFQIEGNCLKLYYDEKLKGVVNIFVNKGIKSSQGLTLPQNTAYQRTLGNADKPSLSFLSNGAILPLSSNLTIQFSSVYLRGVVVRVIEVPQKNMGQYLQTSNLNEGGEIRRVGRLVNQDVIFLDEDPTIDLTTPHVFSINLSRLFNASAGNLYSIELSASSKLTAYPCSDSEMPSKEEVQQYFAQTFAAEKLSLEGSGYYYYFSNGDPYSWWDNDDPCKSSYYDDLKCSKNVVATNFGITAKCGADNKILVWVNNLITTKSESGVDIKVYNYQHGLTAEGSTNSDGFAELAYTNGKPFYLTASKDGDIAYLRVDDGASLSLSDFETSGKQLQSGLNGFIYGDRGVWRPGDTLHLGFMLGDRAKTLPKDHPVILEMTNPLGQIYARRTLSKGVLGIYSFNIPIAEDAPTGLWAAKVNVGGATFTKYVRIESIMPNRLKVSPDYGKGIIVKGKPINGSLHTEWLNGAVARGYKFDIQAMFTNSTTSFSAYKDYNFTQLGSRFSSEESGLITGVTDAEGNSPLSFTLNGGSKAPGMLNVTLTTKVYEPSGQFSIDVTRKQYSPYATYVGVSTTQKGKDFLETDKEHPIRMVVVDANGNPVSGQRVNIKIYKIGWYWWWNSDESYLAEYSSNSYNQEIVNKTLATDASGNATLNFTCHKADWGTYLICVKDLTSGHMSSTMAYYDYYGNPEKYGNSDAATKLSFKTDKDTYKVGEKIKFKIPSSEGAKALVTIENSSKVLDAKIVECNGQSTQIEIPVTSEMRPNVFVYVSLIQQYDQTENDHPLRLYGVASVTVNDPDSHLVPVIDVKDEILPNTNFSVKVSEKSGKEMAYTIAIVDEGLLDLTHFKTPDPWAAFNANEALGVRTWDAYNMVIGAYGGKIEQLFSIGGDEDAAANGAKALVNRFTPVVKFAGPFYLKGGSTTHKFYMPNYNGKVRVMVVAGNGSAYGSSDKSVLVRQPVMVIGTLPRVIGQDEEITVPATVFATKPGVGNVKVSISCSKNLSLTGNAETSMNFASEGDMVTRFSIKAGSTSGTAMVTIKASAGGCEAIYQTELEIRSIADEITKFQDVKVDAGKEWKGTIKAFGMPGTNNLSVELGGTRPLNLSSRIEYLESYPHGCLEQMVSKAFPLVYINNLTSLSDADKAMYEQTVNYVLNRLSAYQVFDGSLAYWPGSTQTNLWGSIYAGHFIAEAEKAGYSIPYSLKQNLNKYLKNSANNWKLSDKASQYVKASEISTQSYRLYVLGLAGNSNVAALNRLKEEAKTSLSKWLVAGAYALTGRMDMCEKYISSVSDMDMSYSGYNPTFGSDIRDNALRLQVLTILDHQSEADQLYNSIADALASERWYSTQDIAVALASVAKYQTKYGKPEPAKGSVQYGKSNEKFNTTVGYTAQLCADADKYEDIVIKNTGSQPLYVHFVNRGSVKGDNTSAQNNGVSLAVSYTDANFRPVNVTELEQGTNFIATITVKNDTPLDMNNLALTHIIPSGWEILNTKFTSESADEYASGISYQDIRDDRMLTYIDSLPSGKQVTVTVKLTASYLGTYTLPTIKCEAMYDSKVSARTASGTCIIK